MKSLFLAVLTTTAAAGTVEKACPSAPPKDQCYEVAVTYVMPCGDAGMTSLPVVTAAPTGNYITSLRPYRGTGTLDHPKTVETVAPTGDKPGTYIVEVPEEFFDHNGSDCHCHSHDGGDDEHDHPPLGGNDDNDHPPVGGNDDDQPPASGDEGDESPSSGDEGSDNSPPSDGDDGENPPPTSTGNGETPPPTGDNGENSPPTGDNGENPPPTPTDGNGENPPPTPTGGNGETPPPNNGNHYPDYPDYPNDGYNYPDYPSDGHDYPDYPDNPNDGWDYPYYPAYTDGDAGGESIDDKEDSGDSILGGLGSLFGGII